MKRPSRNCVAGPAAFSLLALSPLGGLGARPAVDPPRLNEVDADTPGVDAAEFVEVLVPPEADPAGLVLVVYDGGAPGDPALRAVALDGALEGALEGRASAQERFVTVGAPGVPGVDIVGWSTNGLQNGADAVALYRAPGLAADAFVGTPAGAPPAGAIRLDALVYGTDDAPDPELIAALDPGGTQWDEASGGSPTDRSLQRVGEGPLAWVAIAPTPSAANAPNIGTRKICELQGAAHRSPHEGRFVVAVEGVVTSLRDDAFTLEAWPPGDRSAATSEAVEVYVQGEHGLSVGARVAVSGVVQEWRAADSEGLTVTRLAASGWDTVDAERGQPGGPLPATRLGARGRRPPTEIVDDDSHGSAEASDAQFDPALDGLDFWESLEWMRVVAPAPRVVGSSAGFGLPVVVVDDGRGATGLSPRGTLVWTPSDEAPERLPLGSAHAQAPSVAVGDRLPGELLGILSYAGEMHRLDAFEYPAVQPGRLGPRTLEPCEGLTVATLNVRNLSGLSPAPVFVDLAASVVHGLAAPDLIAVAEVQDDSGAADDGTVGADGVWATWVQAIEDLGGPAYRWTDIAPLDGEDGGQPGGNIRVGFLWRADRIELVERPGGDARTAAHGQGRRGALELHPSPGRVAPSDPAWLHSRKPLAAEFRMGGARFFAVANHFTSKGPDEPTFGWSQPPVAHSRVQRMAQARVVREFVGELLSIDPGAAVVVLGDLNDTEPSRTLTELAGGALVSLSRNLDPLERATFLYRGRAEMLDHILVSPALRPGARVDVAHLHAEFPLAPTDHDPVRATLRLPEGDRDR